MLQQRWFYTQIRSGLSEAVVIASVYYLKERKIAKYIAYVIIGSLFHIAALFFLILLLLYFDRTRKFNGTRNFIYLIIMIALFYIASSFRSYYAGFVIYLITFALATWIIQRKLIRNDIKRLLSR